MGQKGKPGGDNFSLGGHENVGPFLLGLCAGLVEIGYVRITEDIGQQTGGLVPRVILGQRLNGSFGKKISLLTGRRGEFSQRQD